MMQRYGCKTDKASSTVSAALVSFSFLPKETIYSTILFYSAFTHLKLTTQQLLRVMVVLEWTNIKLLT